MYWVYILRSTKDGWIYTGHTKDPQARLREHNYGRVKSTSAHLPYKLAYAEAYKSRSEAMKRELYLKSGYGRNLRNKLIKLAV